MTPTVPAFDLVIVGGGIHGAGIARDAALRGLRVALFERDDFGSGTSTASSKLVHGGLRYLESFNFGLVRESLRERRTLLRIAPHLVRPLPLIAPITDGGRWSRLMLGTGLNLYDLLAGRQNLERHRWLDRSAVVEAEPALDRDGLRGGYRFFDGQMDDARMVIENVLDAAKAGAHVRNGVEVTDLIVENGSVRGVRVRDEGSNESREVTARLVINAAGPWYGEIAARQNLTQPISPRLSRGTHIVLPSITRGHGFLLTARRDDRVIFILPYKGRTLVGTTDIDHPDRASDAQPTPEEIAYLLHEVNAQLVGRTYTRDDVLYSFAGVRALRPGEEEDPGQVPREAELREDAPGLLGVLGGKYTTYRAVAERVVDAAERRIRGRTSRCETATRPLPGGDAPHMNDYFRVAEDLLTEKYDRLEVGVLRYLVGTYGARHLEILKLLDDDPSGAKRVEPGLPFLLAEVEHCVRREWARSVDDLVRRRCYRRYLGNWDDAARERWHNALERAKAKLAAER